MFAIVIRSSTWSESRKPLWLAAKHPGRASNVHADAQITGNEHRLSGCFGLGYFRALPKKHAIGP
jgi:hypothetical protein